MIYIPILLILLSYLLGCFSTARFIAKWAKSLNIYRVGTGHADSENIYENISHPLGLMVGAIDAAKMYMYLLVVNALLMHTFPHYVGVTQMEQFASRDWMMVYGFMMIVGHCLPVTHRFKGGRGIFTWSGYMAWLAFWPTAVAATLSTFVLVRFHQVRFSQYMVVLLPPFLFQISNKLFHTGYPGLMHTLLAAILMGVLNFFVSKRKGEF